MRNDIQLYRIHDTTIMSLVARFEKILTLIRKKKTWKKISHGQLEIIRNAESLQNRQDRYISQVLNFRGSHTHHNLHQIGRNFARETVAMV